LNLGGNGIVDRRIIWAVRFATSLTGVSGVTATTPRVMMSEAFITVSLPAPAFAAVDHGKDQVLAVYDTG
jgi:hypothetical protein